MKNELELKVEQMGLTQLVENNQQTILFLESRLSDLPENMSKKWGVIREVLVKNSDITERGGTDWQKDLIKVGCNDYKNLQPWQSLILNLSNIDPNFWSWEEYWAYCKKYREDYWDQHAACDYKAISLQIERKKVHKLLSKMFTKEIKDAAEMSSYGIQKVLAVMNEISTFDREWLTKLQKKTGEFLEWKANKKINEIIRWNEEQKLSTEVVKN